MTLGKNGKLAVKWGIYLLLLFLCCGLQGTPSLFSIDGIKPLFLPALAVSLAFFENEIAAGAYGLAAGLLWDVMAGKVFGFFGILLMLCCITATLLSMYCLRVNYINMMLLNGAVIVLCLLWDYSFNYLLWGYEGHAAYLLRYFFVTLYSLPFSFLTAFLIRKIASRFSPVIRA